MVRIRGVEVSQAELSRQFGLAGAQTGLVNRQVIFAAAHAHFPDSEPLGGGKTVADYLIQHCPDWQVLSPATCGLAVPKPLVDLSALEYARFCRQFERVTTAAIGQHDPARCVVLTNDISEGPDFAALGARGYRVVAVWHVDVVDYFCRIYLRGRVDPATAARWSRHRWLPDLLKLVFHKQADCVRHCARLVVPSAPMAAVIGRCYPACPPAKIAVVPWGNLAAAAAGVAEANGAGEDEVVIMTLSRLSPEKGIERLLRALPLVRGRYRVWICGAPAFMQGRRYAARLRRLAGARVEFLGHVTGARKAALLQRADIFVSASRHESYGLTLAEAAAAGCRIVSHGHYGASGQVVDCEQPGALAGVLTALVQAGRTGQEPGPAVPSPAVARVTELLLQAGAIFRTSGDQ